MAGRFFVWLLILAFSGVFPVEARFTLFTHFPYNEVGDIKSITDNLYTSGTNSATISSVAYDNLHRLTSLTRPSSSATTFTYNVIGNMTANGEQGGSTYIYPTSGILPHAVRIVGTKTNAYDLVGNMVFRAGQSLGYDPENRLTSVVSGGVMLATFGYADDGDRLWKQSTNTLSVWIGDLYEAHGATNLFHIFAGSRRIATIATFTSNVRGRTLKTARDLTVNSQSYINQFLYDNADRQISVAYPVSGPTITNRYDSGGNLTQVQRVDAGGSTLYFQSKGYSQLRELLGATSGNGTEINYTYFTKTRRLQNLASKKTSAGTNFQSLAYTYNEVGDIKSITDNLYSGTNSATISNVAYDNLHRLTSLTRSSATTFTYNVLGNMTANGEQGSSTYVYPTSGILPHAVRIVGTKTNAYDLVGNMVFRAGQSLGYDPENRLTSVVSGGVTLATFGYSDDGDRLWKQS